jgi:Phage capsid family
VVRPLVPEDIPRLARRERETAVATLCRAVLGHARGVLEPRTRSAVAPASTTSTAALTQTMPAFLSTLVPSSAAADVLERGVQLRWDGAVSITLPSMALGFVDWVPEGAPFPVRQYSTSPGPTIRPYKLGSLVSLTGEMMRSSNAEALVRQVLTDSLGPALDAKLFSNAAEVLGTSPAGLLAGISGLTASAATSRNDALIEDIAALASAVSVVAGKSSIVFVMHPAQSVAVGLRTLGEFAYDVLPSNSVAPKTVVCIATNTLAVALEDQPVIDASKEGVMHMETGPSAIVGDTGVSASPVRSLFQTDSVGLKIRWPISWALRDIRGVAYTTGVTW